MERAIEPASPAAPTPVSPAELLERARARFPVIEVGGVIDGAALRETLRAAYEAARLEASLAPTEQRQEDPRYLAFLGDVYLLANDHPSARNCWLRAATLGDTSSLARVAGRHTEPERALLYARLYRENAEDRPAGVCANLVRLLRTEPSTSDVAVRLSAEARRWQPDHDELLYLLEFATVTSRS